MNKFVGSTVFAIILTMVLNLLLYVGIFFGFMWCLDYFGVLEILKGLIK